MKMQEEAKFHIQEAKPQDQLIGDANICMHDLANQGCLSPQLHCSEQPVNMNI